MSSYDLEQLQKLSSEFYHLLYKNDASLYKSDVPLYIKIMDTANQR